MLPDHIHALHLLRPGIIIRSCSTPKAYVLLTVVGSAGTERSSSSFSSSVTGGAKLTYADLGGAGWGMEASHRPTFAAPVRCLP